MGSGIGPAGEGLRLDDLLGTHGALPIPQVESILRWVGKALAHLHAPPRGMVHGNVRPESIWVAEGGRAILGEPGIPQAETWDGADMNTGLVLENTEYMSPEECRGLPRTPSSDQYALGAVAYAMLAGRPPFVGAFYRVLVAHLSEGFVPLLELRPDCPPGLASAVERMLAKDPADRWADMGQAVRAAVPGPGGSDGVETAGTPGIAAPLPEAPATEWEAPDRSESPHSGQVPVGSPGASRSEPAHFSAGGSEPAESPAPGVHAQAGEPVSGRRKGLGAALAIQGEGPDLGPPPAHAMEVEEEDVDEEEELAGDDRRSLFFEPTSPPPAQGWTDDTSEFPLDEGAGRSRLPAELALLPAPAPVRFSPPRRSPGRRRRRAGVFLLLIVAGGTGWGLWTRFGVPGGFADRPGADGVEDGSRFGDASLDRDDFSLALLPAPEPGPVSRAPTPQPIPSEELFPRGQLENAPAVPVERSSPPPRETTVVPAPEPETRSTPVPSPAQPAPPPETRPPPQEPAPVVLGSLEMNIRPWANVLVNGVSRGRFQTRVALDLPAGTHFVRMSNPNFPPFDTTVVIEGGETTVLNKVLQPDSER